MAGLLVQADDLGVLPVVGRGGLEGDELYLHGRFPDNPALQRARSIGFHLPDLGPVGRPVPKPQGKGPLLAGKGKSPVLLTGYPPLLVGVAGLFTPLENRMFSGAVAVQAQEGMTVEKLVHILPQRTQLPHLSGIPLLLLGKEDGRIRLDGAGHIQHPSVRSTDFVTLLSVKQLGRCGQRQHQSGQNKPDFSHSQRLTILLCTFRPHSPSLLSRRAASQRPLRPWEW